MAALAGPMVRIRLPPAESPLRTRLPRKGLPDSPDRSRPGRAPASRARERLLAGAALRAVGYLRAIRWRLQLRDRVAVAFADIDVVIAASSMDPACGIDGYRLVGTSGIARVVPGDHLKHQRIAFGSALARLDCQIGSWLSMGGSPDAHYRWTTPRGKNHSSRPKL